MDILTFPPALIIITCLLLGLVVGSFLNVVIHRLPIMMEHTWVTESADYLEIEHTQISQRLPVSEASVFNLATPRSRCPHCQHAISAQENIPLLSYAFLKGRCKACKANISARYPLVELVTGLLSAAFACALLFAQDISTAPHAGETVFWQLLFGLVLIWSLIALTGIDYDTMLLPDNITLPLLWLGIVANYFSLFTDLESAVLGAIFGYLSLWSVFWLFKLTTGKEGMGYGDFKLLAALGAWLGWQMLPVIIIGSSFVGAIVGIGIMIASRDKQSKPIPFGPYLAAAGWIALMWGDKINQWYLSTLA